MLIIPRHHVFSYLPWRYMDGAKAKIKWAEKHITELDTAIDRFLDPTKGPKPYRIDHKRDPKTRTHLINSSARSNSSLSKAFQESFQRSIRNEQPTDGNSVATQTAV